MDKKNKVFAIIMIILLSVMIFISLVLATGNKILRRENFERFFRETDDILTLSNYQISDLENYFAEEEVSVDIVRYINDNENIRALLEELLLNIYDNSRSGEELQFNEEEIIKVIETEVNKFESQKNIIIWNYIDEDVASVVSSIKNSYNNEYVFNFKIIFSIFSDKTVIIALIVTLLISLPLLVSRKIWGILYMAIAAFISFAGSYYVVNYMDLSNEYLPQGIMDNLKAIANENIRLLLFVIFLLIGIFIMYFIVKPIIHKINVRIKASNM